jgi:hypothetical protein
MTPSRGDDTMDASHEAIALGALGEEVVPEQHADLVAGELHVPAVGARHRDGEAVGVGIVGEDEVGPHALRERDREVERALLLGVGEGHRGEAPSGSACSGTDDVRSPLARQRQRASRSPTPCSGVYTIVRGDRAVAAHRQSARTPSR